MGLGAAMAIHIPFLAITGLLPETAEQLIQLGELDVKNDSNEWPGRKALVYDSL